MGDKAVYKHDLERTKDGKRRAPPAGASKSVVIVGPTSHNNEHKQYVFTSTEILCCVVFICIYYTYLDNINVYMIILYTHNLIFSHLFYRNYHKKPTQTPKNQSQAGIPTGSTTTTADDMLIDMNLSLQEQLQLQTKKDNIAETLRQTASQSLETERIRM